MTYWQVTRYYSAMIPQDFLPVFPMPDPEKKKKEARGFAEKSAQIGKTKRRAKAPKPPARAFRDKPQEHHEQGKYWHGKTLGEISRESGIVLSTVSRVYNRIRRPTLDVAICLSSALGLTIDALLHELFADSKGRLVHLPKGLAPVTDTPAADDTD